MSTDTIEAVRTVVAAHAGLERDASELAPDDDLFDVDQPRPRDGYASYIALIDELLTNQDLAPETRQELLDFKSDIAEGEFTDMDAKYLRDLHARLSRRQRHSA